MKKSKEIQYIGAVVANKSQIDQLKNDVMWVEQKFNLFENDKLMVGQWSGFSVYRKEGEDKAGMNNFITQWELKDKERGAEFKRFQREASCQREREMSEMFFRK